MNPALVVLYLLALVGRGDPNSLHRSLNGSALNVSRSACTGEAVSLPAIPDIQQCTDGRAVLINPDGARIETPTGRYTEKDGTWSIANVQHSDSGIWTSQKYCNEGKRTLRVLLEVNCESLAVYTGDRLSLHCPKPKIPPNATNIHMMLYCEFATKPGEGLKVLVDGRITEKAAKTFRGRAMVGPDDHTLIINNLKKSDTGNYTCMWRWVDVLNRVSRKYMYRITVTAATKPLTTTHAPTTYGTATHTVVPTGGKSISRGGCTKACQWFLPLLMFFWIA